MIADKTKKRNGLNFFRREDMIDYFRKLPLVNEIESRYLTVNEPIAIMTHDDSFDMEFETYEQKHGYTSTTFIFQHKITDAGKSAKTDMQIHYSKFSHLTLHEQIQKFKEKLNKNPTINRTHRLWWRESHLDLANLAMHGIQVDSTLIGYRPFRLVAQQRLLPIWEVPFSVVDAGAISVCNLYL